MEMFILVGGELLFLGVFTVDGSSDMIAGITDTLKLRDFCFTVLTFHFNHLGALNNTSV